MTFAKFDPKPFKSLAAIEKERVEAIKHEMEQARLRQNKKLPVDPESPEIREPFYD